MSLLRQPMLEEQRANTPGMASLGEGECVSSGSRGQDTSDCIYRSLFPKTMTRMEWYCPFHLISDVNGKMDRGYACLASGERLWSTFKNASDVQVVGLPDVHEAMP